MYVELSPQKTGKGIKRAVSENAGPLGVMHFFA